MNTGQTDYKRHMFLRELILGTARSEAWRCGSSVLGLRVPFPPGVCMYVCMTVSCDFCMLSGRGLFDVLIIHPEEHY
jgi:hypothetical protein